MKQILKNSLKYTIQTSVAIFGTKMHSLHWKETNLMSQRQRTPEHVGKENNFEKKLSSCFQTGKEK